MVWGVSDALFQAGLNELVEVAIEDALCVAALDIGAQILDARLVKDIGTDLMTPADVGLGIFEFLLLCLAFADFRFIQP